jgi:WD domain, G-beta repeat
MSITLVCPGCQRSLRARPEFLGRNVQCPSCKMTFTAQTPPDEDPLPVLGLAPPQAPRQTNPDDFSPEPRADDQRSSPRATPGPAVSRGPEPRRSRPSLRFPVRVLEDSAGEMVGPVEAEVSRDGLRLHGTGQVLFLAPLGTPATADDDELEIELSRRTLRLKVRGPNGRRLAADVADFLAGQSGPLDPRDYQPRRSPAVVLLTTVATLLVTVGSAVGGYYLVRSLMAPARVADSAWKEFTPPGVKGRVLMPGTPRTQNQNQPGFDGPLRMYMVELKRPNSVFIFGHARLPAWNVGRLTLEQRFEGARQGMLSNTKGATFVSQRDIRLGEHPGREYVFDIQKKGKMVVRLYVAGRDLYMLLVGGDGFKVDTPDVRKFLDSFRLTGAKPEPPKPPEPPRPFVPPPKPFVPPPPPREPPKVSPPVEHYPIPLVKTLPSAVPGSSKTVIFAPDGQTLHSGPDVWETATWQRSPHRHSSLTGVVTFSRDGTSTATGSSHLVILTDQTGHRTVLILSSPRVKGTVLNLTFSPDGRTLAGWTETALVLWDVPTPRRRERASFPLGKHRWQPAAVFTPDGSALITSDGEKTVAVRAPRGGEVRKEIVHPDGVTALALAPDGRTLVVATGNREVTSWDLATGAQQARVGTSEREVTALAFAPDGRLLASVDGEGNLQLWDVQARRSLHRFSAHSVAIIDVCFSPDGRFAATCGKDGKTRVWDVSALVDRKALPPRKEAGTPGALQPIKSGNGVLVGKVTLKGPEPDYAALDAAVKRAIQSSVDSRACAEGAHQQQRIVDRGTRGVKNVVVFLKPVDPKGQFFDVSTLVKAKKGFKPVEIIDVPHCQYDPRVTTLFPVYIDPARPSRNYLKGRTTGQKLYVISSSPIKHSIRWINDPATRVSNGSVLVPHSTREQPERGLELSQRMLPSYNMPVKLDCNIHRWMQGYIWVLPHSFAAVTNDRGEFKIENLPVGVKVRVIVWHEGKFINGKDGEEIELKGPKMEKDFVIEYRR